MCAGLFTTLLLTGRLLLGVVTSILPVLLLQLHRQQLLMQLWFLRLLLGMYLVAFILDVLLMLEVLLELHILLFMLGGLVLYIRQLNIGLARF